MIRPLVLLLLVSGCLPSSANRAQQTAVVEFPAPPDIVVDGQFRGAEGIAFSGEGRLFVTADRKLWEVFPTGAARRVADLSSTVGLAPIGARDVLVAEFGPLVRLSSGPHSDGALLRVTLEGEIDTVASGLGDPNFILVRRGNKLLVSDDFTDEIVFRTGGAGSLDGLAMDEQGRVYVAANREGRLWRFDPRDGSALIIAENVAGIASLAFGAGAFDERSLYATQLRGGRIWRFQDRYTGHAARSLRSSGARVSQPCCRQQGQAGMSV